MNNNENYSIYKDVVNQSDIVAIIGQFIKLKKVGANYVGLCPFHADSKPSLTINPKKKIWKCFVCGVGGNVIKFVQMFKKVTNLEALKIVGEMIGFDFSKHEILFKNSQFDINVKYLFDINKICCELYQGFLYDKKNISKLEYLHNRGLDDETIKKFKIGYAPGDVSLIYSILTNKDNMFGEEYDKSRIFNEQQLVDAGIITINENGTAYDFFNDRITFPIFNNDGMVVGFSGRTTKNAEPKYLNSKENKVFIKSNILYNFFNAVNSKSDKLIIVEGYMDAIAFARAGYDNVVATMGTALSAEHIKLMQTTEFNTFILAFDNDHAGVEANIANGLKLIENNLNTFVIGTYDKNIKDIDELLTKQKVEGVKKVFDSRVDYISFLINTKLKDVTSLDEKITNVKYILKVMNDNDDILLKTQHLQAIANLTGIHIDDLMTQYDSLRSNKQKEYGYAGTSIAPKKQTRINTNTTDDAPRNEHQLHNMFKDLITIAKNYPNTIDLFKNKINLALLNSSFFIETKILKVLILWKTRNSLTNEDLALLIKTSYGNDVALYIDNYFSSLPHSSEISIKQTNELINNICTIIYNLQIQYIKKEIELELAKDDAKDLDKIKELRNKQLGFHEKKKQIK